MLMYSKLFTPFLTNRVICKETPNSFIRCLLPQVSWGRPGLIVPRGHVFVVTDNIIDYLLNERNAKID